MSVCKICVIFSLLYLVTTINAQLSYRLNKNVLPELYDIKLTPYLLPSDGVKQFKFDGVVWIRLQSVKSGIDEIVLHKDYIEIKKATLHDSGRQVIQELNPKTDLSFEQPTDKLTIKLAKALIPNLSYELYLEYEGQIRDGMAGFFRANYKDANGTEKLMALTQSQRIDARTLFPCFDEPGFKAKFRMQVSRPVGYRAFFNTRRIETTKHGDDRFIDHFAETPLMSTYLVAVIVSEYVTRGDANLVIVTRQEYHDKVGFSLNVSAKTLHAYDELFRLPYKSLGNTILQKASSPKFPHNGMENWGLVIYSDAVLVHEPGYTDGWEGKQYTITILVHETAHMWFGNSVTFAWWSYFWLNEAFARYYQYFLAHEIYPEYQLDQQFVVNQVHLIFGIDAVNSTQPLTTPEEEVNTPSEIGKKFSGIAYAKGATIVRMIRNLMGQEQFDNAIHDYLKENHLRNTRPNDLFEHLKAHWLPGDNVDLDQFFSDWTEQVGFPMVRVKLAENGLSMTVTQERFLLDPKDGSDTKITYTIPITFATNLNRNFKNLQTSNYFNKTSEQWMWTFDEPIDWVIFNLQQSNYYRVFYEKSLLNKIQHVLSPKDHGGIHVANRAQLVDDLFNYGRIALVDYEDVFTFIEYLETETDYLPWYAAFAGMQRVAQRLNPAQQVHFSIFLTDITNAVYKKLGFENKEDTVLDVYNRNKMVSWLCKYNHEQCNKDARLAFSMATMDPTSLMPSPDFRKTLYCAGVRAGDENDMRKLQSRYFYENVSSEKELLAHAMGCTGEYIEEHFNFTLIELPSEHTKIALSAMFTENPKNIQSVFHIFMEHVEDLEKALGSWANVANLFSEIANYFTTKEEEDLFAKFINEKGQLFDTSKSTLESALKNAVANRQWAEQHLSKLVRYLERRKISNNASSRTTFSVVGIFLLLGIFFIIL